VRSGRPAPLWRETGAVGYALAGVAALCWATGALTAKWVFQRLAGSSDFGIGPAELSAARALMSFVLLAGFLAVRRPAALRVPVRDLPFLALFGVVGLAMVHFTYFKTLSLTNVATALLLEYLAPILVLIVSVTLLGERFSWALPSAVALSVLGCALMVGAIGGHGLLVSASGIAWGLASAVFFATYTLLGKRASGRISSWALLTYGFGFAALFWAIYLRGLGPVFKYVSTPVGLGVVTYLAVFATIIPFGAFLRALRHIDATKASVTATLEPVVAALGAFVLFGETLTALQLAGGALVLAAILVVQAPALLGRAPDHPAELPSPG
jgi:drug/metabolite transporter (DMT)-like permease